MSTDLENLTANFGLLKREFRDVHAVVSRLDTQVRRLVEPVAIHRPAGLVARYAACTLIALKAKRSPEAIATQHFAADRDLARLIELKAAVTPAMTGVAGWASELAAVVVVDIATNCCRQARWRSCAPPAARIMRLSMAPWRACRCIRRRRRAALSPRAAPSRSVR
jgi:hypothetical protein